MVRSLERHFYRRSRWNVTLRIGIRRIRWSSAAAFRQGFEARCLGRSRMPELELGDLTIHASRVSSSESRWRQRVGPAKCISA